MEIPHNLRFGMEKSKCTWQPKEKKTHLSKTKSYFAMHSESKLTKDVILFLGKRYRTFFKPKTYKLYRQRKGHDVFYKRLYKYFSKSINIIVIIITIYSIHKRRFGRLLLLLVGGVSMQNIVCKFLAHKYAQV